MRYLANTHRALILAAGRGSRLGRLTADRPKALVHVGKKSLIERVLSSLSEAGIEDIRIVTGYQSHLLASYSNNTFNNPNWATTGIFYSASTADAWLCQGDTIISYSDIFYGPNLVRHLCAAAHNIAIGYDPNAAALWRQRSSEPLSDLESFRFDRGLMRLVEIGARNPDWEDVQGQYMGLIKVTAEGWRQLESTAKRLPSSTYQEVDFTTLLSLTIAHGVPVHVVENKEPWGEVDHASDIALYERQYFGVHGG